MHGRLEPAVDGTSLSGREGQRRGQPGHRVTRQAGRCSSNVQQVPTRGWWPSAGYAAPYQAQRRSESEEALFDAAAEVIAERGTDRASLASIGERAGGSRRVGSRADSYNKTVITDEELRALPPAEIADLARRLSGLLEPDVVVPALRRRRHRFIMVMTTACVLLIPWTVFLAVTLPRRYVAGHWGLTWVGFDFGLAVCLAATAIFAWHARQALIPACFITATLLACDAWFDVTTASTLRDTVFSVLSAAFVELPLGCLLSVVGVRLLRFVVFRARSLSQPEGPTSLCRTAVFGIPVWEIQRRQNPAPSVG